MPYYIQNVFVQLSNYHYTWNGQIICHVRIIDVGPIILRPDYIDLNHILIFKL